MLLDNLSTVGMLASSCTANQPSNNRYIILQDYLDGNLVTVGARYQDGEWFGATTCEPLPISEAAIWSETLLGEPST